MIPDELREILAANSPEEEEFKILEAPAGKYWSVKSSMEWHESHWVLLDINIQWWMDGFVWHFGRNWNHWIAKGEHRTSDLLISSEDGAKTYGEKASMKWGIWLAVLLWKCTYSDFTSRSVLIPPFKLYAKAGHPVSRLCCRWVKEKEKLQRDEWFSICSPDRCGSEMGGGGSHVYTINTVRGHATLTSDDSKTWRPKYHLHSRCDHFRGINSPA